MKKIFYVIMAGALLLALTGCKDETPKTGDKAPAQPQVKTMQGTTGTVVEKLDADPYTYVLVDTGSEEKMWVATQAFPVAVGDAVIVPEGGQLMENFPSKTLNRTFEKVWFVEAVGTPGAAMATAAEAADHSRPVVTAGDVDLSGIKQAKQTIAQVYADKDTLAGKEIEVRGKVVKFSQQIMNTNWLHVQDGTGTAGTNGANGTNDLTVTTDAVVNVGDTVVVKGVLVANKDFGFGYKYDVIIEKASVSVE